MGLSGLFMGLKQLFVYGTSSSVGHGTVFMGLTQVIVYGTQWIVCLWD